MTAPAERDTYRSLSAAAVLLVAAIAATVSFVHIESLAVRYGQPLLAAWLLPVSIDGTVAVASLTMLRAARLELSAPWLARTMLLLSVGATLACNVAYGLPHGWPGALLSGWPAVAFVGSAEVAISMSRKRPRRDRTRDGRHPASATRHASRTRQQQATRPRPARISDADTEALALAELARQPDLSGAELGRLVGTSPRTGQRILSRLNGRAALSASEQGGSE
jgi:Protein of unknown function (DUF2637)